MQLAVPGVTAEDLALLKRWYWSDELKAEPETAIFRIEVRSYLMHIYGLNVLIDTPAQAASPKISISCCARICTQIMWDGIRA